MYIHLLKRFLNNFSTICLVGRLIINNSDTVAIVYAEPLGCYFDLLGLSSERHRCTKFARRQQKTAEAARL